MSTKNTKIRNFSKKLLQKTVFWKANPVLALTLPKRGQNNPLTGKNLSIIGTKKDGEDDFHNRMHMK
jgi:hypothetical protein